MHVSPASGLWQRMMTELALFTDGEFECLFLLLGCLVAVGAVVWIDASHEAHGQSRRADGDIGQISDNLIDEEVTRVVFVDHKNGSLASVREEDEECSNKKDD